MEGHHVLTEYDEIGKVIARLILEPGRSYEKTHRDPFVLDRPWISIQWESEEKNRDR